MNRSLTAARYSDPAFLALEIERVFGRGWVMLCAARLVAEPGDYATIDLAGLPVALVRDLDGTLRAFVNSCRHRGTQLLEGRGNIRAIRCPYHDWKYSLDGRLRHVPRQEGFEPFDRDGIGLLPLTVDVAIGFVFATRGTGGSLRASAGPIFDEVAPYALEEMRPIQERWSTVPCNWKAVLDNATESYHLPVVHGMSVDQHVSVRAQFRTYGDHYRLTLPIAPYGFRGWLDRATSRGGPYTVEQLSVLHKYVIFPNFLMNVLPYHLTVFQVWPDGPDRCRFFYGFYERAGARGLEWLRARATWLASQYIWAEDHRILAKLQPGVRAGRDATHRTHEDEVAIAHFHSVLDRWLADEPG